MEGVTSRLLFAIAAGAIGSAFQHGYHTGVVNVPIKILQNFINHTYSTRNGEDPGEDKVELIYSLMSSIYCVGGMVGALMTAYMATTFGRKGGLLINNVFVLVGCIIMMLAKPSSSYELLILGRFIIGINSGLAGGLAPMYLNEISPTSLRGAVGTLYQLILVIAILVSNGVGFGSLLGSDERWPYLFAVPLIPMVFMLVTLPLCPESPKYVLIIQKREGSAASGLSWLRGTLEINSEMEEMRQEAASTALVPQVTAIDMWKNPIYRQPMIISIVVMLSQQFSGINAVIFYSSHIFVNAGLDEKTALYSTLGMSVINLIMTIVSLMLIERSGRRTLHLLGLGGMIVTTVILTISVLHQEVAFLRIVSILMVLGFVIMFAIGPGPIPWFLVGELFGSGARGLATSIAVCINWGANFIVTVGFLPLQSALDGYVFLIFTNLLIIFWCYTYVNVPETKGKTTEEVASFFRRKSSQEENQEPRET